MNTIDELKKYLFSGSDTTLELIHELNYSRYKLYKSEHDIDNTFYLTSFVILGRYCTDEFGQLSEIYVDCKDYNPDNVLKVIALQDFYQYIRIIHPGDDYPTDVVRRLGKSFPTDGHTCPHCNSKWTARNGNKGIEIRKNQIIDGTPFIGKTIEQLADHIKTEEKFYSRLKEFVKNDKYQEEFDKVWILADDGHVIESGDSFSVENTYFYHSECLIEEKASTWYNVFRQELFIAGFNCIKHEYITSDYDNTNKWSKFTIELDNKIIEIIIGWRKRVIEITYYREFGNLFPDIAETNGTGYFHCYDGDLSTRLSEMYNKMKAHYENRTV